MSVLVACVYVYHIYSWCLLRSEEGVSIPGTEVREQLNCVGAGNQALTLCGNKAFHCWPSLQPHVFLFCLFPFTLFSGFIMYCLLCLIPFSD